MKFKKYLESLNHSKNDLHKIITYSEKLIKMIDDQELEDWVKAKLTHAEDYLNIVLDYVKYYKTEEQKNKMSIGNLRSIKDKAEELEELIDNVGELKDWVKSKLNLAGEYLDDVYHHLDYKHKK
jgi:small nuclear ribonucleoprotein (snRNP)-like protein